MGRLHSLSRSAFTLIELLAVVAIVGVLAALLLPGLGAAQQTAARAVCLSNLHQIGLAVQAYAGDSGGYIPFGPKAPPFLSPADFYPSTGAPTSLISLQGGAPVGLGLMLAQQLASTPRVLFCPGADQAVDAAAELAKVGVYQAQGSYYYRHAGATNLFDPPGTNAPPQHLRLDALGNNRNGYPIQALALDTMFLCPPDLAAFNVKPRTHHQQRIADIIFADGHAASRSNKDARFTVNLNNYTEIYQAFDKILGVLERADVEP